MSKNSENVKIFTGQRHIYTGIFVFVIWGISLYLLYYYPLLKDCDDNDSFILYTMMTFFFVFLYLIVGMCVSGKIAFQKNGIKLSGNGEYNGFYKYSEFQKVSYSSYGVSISTTSDREILQINLADFSIDDINSILEEFRRRNKEVVVNDIWYGIIPEKTVKEEKRSPFMRQILEDKGFIAYALIVFYIFSFVGMGLSDSVCYVKPYDGIKKEYYENGTLHHEISYKHGKENGIAKTYYQNGKLSIESEYKDGKQNGIRKEYYENGNLATVAEMKDGKADGITKFYHENGKLKTESEYKDDKITGLKYYDEQGRLVSKTEYMNDEQNGRIIKYDEQGNIEGIFEFKDGKITGIGKMYYASGQLMSEAEYKDKLPNGLFKQYYENGNLEVEANFINGKRNGIIKEYYENGKLKSSADLIDDNGMVTLYDEKGNIIGKKKMMCDVNGCKIMDVASSESKAASITKNNTKKAVSTIKNGVQKEYYENGKLKSEIEYKNNKKHGTAKYYNEVGGLYMEEDWDNGKIIGHRGYDLNERLDYAVKSIKNGTGRAIEYDVYGNDIGWFWMTCDDQGCR